MDVARAGHSLVTPLATQPEKIMGVLKNRFSPLLRLFYLLYSCMSSGFNQLIAVSIRRLIMYHLIHSDLYKFKQLIM